MIGKPWRVIFVLMLLLPTSALASAAGETPSARRASPAPALAPGESEFRAAWIAFAEPITKPAADRTPEERQTAKEAAVSHLEAAVAAAPNNAAYHASLAYVCLTAGKYDKALTAINRAIDLKRGDPSFYLLRGQAEASLAQLKPEEAAKNIGPAMTAFSRAAELDPNNALPLLQAASVAVDVGRADLALDRLKKAVSRSECRLYRLPVPEDLGSGGVSSLSLWEYAQYGHWFGLIARCQNIAGYCLSSGKEAEGKGDLVAAEQRYRWARQVASCLGAAEPRLLITANAAIDILEEAYSSLARVAQAAGSKEAERWKGEAGICEIGRIQLLGALQSYQKDVASGAITSVYQSLQAQAKLVSPVIAGIGLPIKDAPALPAESRPK
jgi:hypothetical protein